MKWSFMETPIRDFYRECVISGWAFDPLQDKLSTYEPNLPVSRPKNAFSD